MPGATAGTARGYGSVSGRPSGSRGRSGHGSGHPGLRGPSPQASSGDTLKSMEKAGSAPRWRFLITPRWLAWHAFAVAAFCGMLWLGDWQFRRAMSGNALSWAYTFEWPLFAIFGAIFWAKTIRDEFRIRSGGTMRQDGDGAGHGLPAGAGPPAGIGSPAGMMPGGGDEPDDEELAAYNAYLERLNNEVRGHGRWHGLR